MAGRGITSIIVFEKIIAILMSSKYLTFFEKKHDVSSSTQTLILQKNIYRVITENTSAHTNNNNNQKKKSAVITVVIIVPLTTKLFLHPRKIFFITFFAFLTEIRCTLASLFFHASDKVIQT